MSPTFFDTSLSDLEIAVFDLGTTGLFPATDHSIRIGDLEARGVRTFGDMIGFLS
jgi:DNA polymerase III alpha subunit (gram-positive type)